MGRHRTVYKKLRDNKVAILGIPSTAKHNEKRKGIVNKTYAVYKTNKALVRKIYDVNSKLTSDSGTSMENSKTFEVGSYVKHDDGIMYTKDKQMAELNYTPPLVKDPPHYTDTYYSDVGRKIKVSKVAHGKYNGTQYTYDENGNMTSQVDYLDGLKHGTEKQWKK